MTHHDDTLLPTPRGPLKLFNVGQDFTNLFDRADLKSMILANEASAVVLTAHLVLEGFLNTWISGITRVDDLFAGINFVPFAMKLRIAANLGLPKPFFTACDKMNSIRNRFSHRRKYALERRELEELKTIVNGVPSPNSKLNCDDLVVYDTKNDNPDRSTWTEITWQSADSARKVLICTSVVSVKLSHWMQAEFASRGIRSELLVYPATELQREA